MSSRLRGAVLVAALAVPLPLVGQQSAPPRPPAGVEALLAEIGAIQERLNPVQEQAMQDEALQREQSEVSALVRSAMLAEDPGMAERLDRLSVIMREVRAAEGGGDEARLMELIGEAMAMQPVIAQAQARALKRPDVAPRVEAFRTHLRARMTELDPECRSLFERLDALDRRVQEALRAAPSGN